MQSRKDEILAKKAKLAELKRQKELRQQEFSAIRESPGPETSPLPNRTENRNELDSLISSLVGGEKGTGSPVSTDLASPSKIARCQPTKEGPPASSPADKASSSSQSLTFAPLTTIYEIRSAPPKRETLTYNRGVQTVELWSRSRTSSQSASDVDHSPTRERLPRRTLSRRQRQRDEELRHNIRREVEDELKALHGSQPNEAEAQGAFKQENSSAPGLSNDELDAVTSSNDFLDFVERSSKIIERALDEEYDVLADYRSGNLNGVDEDDDDVDSKGRKGTRVRQVIQFYDQRWSKKRMISDIGFSTKFPELVLSSYTKSPSAPYDPDGLIQVWNLHMHERPEYIFHANSDILTAKFSPFDPRLIIGGTYSGQVLIWDTRTRNSFPDQQTPLTGWGHTHPIYSLNIVGTQNAHNIVSTSTDGVLCTWSIGMLTRPQEYLELSAKTTATSHARFDDLAPTCTAFPASDPTYFLAGTEEGTIHLCHRYDRAGAKAGVDARVAYRSHAAPVMSLDFHRASGLLDLGDLVLSTGLDWSVKLWRVSTPAASIATSDTVVTIVTPLLNIDREDIVYDAKWSPVKPGVFACVDGAGSLEIWDLAVDTEVPVTTATPSPRMDAGIAVPARSLNKCAWESHEGRKVATGGLDGVVTLFEVGTELGGQENLKAEEWTTVKRLVSRLGGRGV